jgi:hypothetical protein
MHKVFINEEISVNKYFGHLLLKNNRKTKCGLFARADLYYKGKGLNVNKFVEVNGRVQPSADRSYTVYLISNK